MAYRRDTAFMEHAIQLALASEREGNLPIGALITLDGDVIAEGKSEVVKPAFHPGRHAEIVALRGVDEALWPRARAMTCYTTLEPCVMCAGALLLHGVGRVVFGARDTLGGAGCILDHLPAYYDEGGVYDWEGPLMQASCEPLYRRADAAFASLPVGRDAWRIGADPDAGSATGPPTTADHDHAHDHDHDHAVLERWLANPGSISLRDARDAATRFAERIESERLPEVLPYARAIFERTGLLKDYRAHARHARNAGHDGFFGEVEAKVRESLPDVWIKRALRDGDVDAAIECWFEHEEHTRARLCADELIAATDDRQVELLISCRISQIDYRVGRGTRRHYRLACALLRRLRDELQKGGEPEYWGVVLEDLTTRYEKRPAFLDELKKAGFLEG